MENNNIYYKKYLKYKIKYINLLNNYQSNKNINEQISGSNPKNTPDIKRNNNIRTPTTTSTHTSTPSDSNKSNNDKRKKQRTRRVKKKKPANALLTENQFLYYFKRLIYNFDIIIPTSDKFKTYVSTNITDGELNTKIDNMKRIICEVVNSTSVNK